MSEERLFREAKAILSRLKGDSQGQVTVVRHMLEELLIAPPMLEIVEGVQILEPTTSRPEDEDCHRYLFGSADPEETWQEIQRSGQKLDAPEPGALAYYGSGNSRTTHVALVLENNTAISKWGQNSPVLRHPLGLVPLSYGDKVGFYRLPETVQVQPCVRDLISKLSGVRAGN